MSSRNEIYSLCLAICFLRLLIGHIFTLAKAPNASIVSSTNSSSFKLNAFQTVNCLGGVSYTWSIFFFSSLPFIIALLILLKKYSFSGGTISSTVSH